MGIAARMENTTGDQAARAAARIVLRPIGSPLPLGMAGLAGASVMLTGYQLAWLPVAQGHDVAAVILLFAVPLQYLASVFGFLGRDSAGGTGMALLGACWTVTGTLTLLSPEGGRSPVLGLLLFFASAVLLVPAVAASLGKAAAATAFVLAAARFALTGIYEYQGGTAWEHASGWAWSCAWWPCTTPSPSRSRTPGTARSCQYSAGVPAARPWTAANLTRSRTSNTKPVCGSSSEGSRSCLLAG